MPNNEINSIELRQITQEELEANYLEVKDEDILCTDRFNRVCCWSLFVSIVLLLVGVAIKGAIGKALR